MDLLELVLCESDWHLGNVVDGVRHYATPLRRRRLAEQVFKLMLRHPLLLQARQLDLQLFIAASWETRLFARVLRHLVSFGQQGWLLGLKQGSFSGGPKYLKSLQRGCLGLHFHNSLMTILVFDRSPKSVGRHLIWSRALAEELYRPMVSTCSGMGPSLRQRPCLEGTEYLGKVSCGLLQARQLDLQLFIAASWETRLFARVLRHLVSFGQQGWLLGLKQGSFSGGPKYLKSLQRGCLGLHFHNSLMTILVFDRSPKSVGRHLIWSRALAEELYRPMVSTCSGMGPSLRQRPCLEGTEYLRKVSCGLVNRPKQLEHSQRRLRLALVLLLDHILVGIGRHFVRSKAFPAESSNCAMILLCRFVRPSLRHHPLLERAEYLGQV
mmetsp:Transcript_107780/g.240467  ORF Transcript_107780/g.240467 Transcript_107780/m.240467 type:complete len:381 (+) Transcript_107780:583-1725(+)